METKYWVGLGLALACSLAFAQQVAPAPPPAPGVAPQPAGVPAPAVDSTSTGTPAVPAAAPVPTAPLITPGVATLGDLDRIQSQIVMTSAKARLAESRQALAKAEGSRTEESIVEDSAPVVAGVFGSAERPYAKFLLAGGGQTIGRSGDMISDGYRVEHVGVDKVVIKDKKGRTIVARFSGTAPAGASSSSEARSQAPVTGGVVSGGAR